MVSPSQQGKSFQNANLLFSFDCRIKFVKGESLHNNQFRKHFELCVLCSIFTLNRNLCGKTDVNAAGIFNNVFCCCRCCC